MEAFYSLSKVSPAWRQAIQSRRVYDTRIGCDSTETIVVHNHFDGTADERTQVVALYSVRDKRCYELPGIPGIQRRIPCACECVSLHGKIYVLGGAKYNDPDDEFKDTFIMFRQWPPDFKKEALKDVYAFDPAGQTQWTRCASMREGRHRFACGVMNGKIYVFGGMGNRGPVGSEAYDPQKNIWSPIKHMPRLRSRDHRVTTLGEELAIYGGEYYHRETGPEAKKSLLFDIEWMVMTLSRTV